MVHLLFRGKIDDPLARTDQVVRCLDVLPIVPRPSMQLEPSHHADDMGQMFGEPSPFSELISATGVPE